MYFVKKKDLAITGGVLLHVVQFQLKNYCKDRTIKIKQLEKNSRLIK